MSVYPRVCPSRPSAAGRNPDIFTIFWPVYHICQSHRFPFQCHSEGGRRQPGGLVRALMGTPDGKPTVNAESQLMAAGPRLYKALIKQLAPHF